MTTTARIFLKPLWLLLVLTLAPPAPTTLAQTRPSADQVADAILERSELYRGVCSLVGAEDGALALALAEKSELLIHVRDPDTERIGDLRQRADNADFPIQRLLAEPGDLEKLPYADNTVDLVIVPASSVGPLAGDSPVKEYFRVLRPGGWLFVNHAEPAFKLPAGIHFTAKTMSKNTGERKWLAFTKDVPAGLDDWSHWEKSPDNNPVSTDSEIVAPYMIQYMAKPYYIGMPAITTVAGGRTFLAMGHIAHHEREWNMLNRLIARNGYNGTVLWEKKLRDDYLVHRSAFVATEDFFHMIDGDHVRRLDAKTGDEAGEIRIPEFRGDWKWIAIDDGILYALAGEPGDGVELVKGKRALGGWSWADLSKGYYPKRIPHGFGDQLAAYDLKTEKVLWTHKEETLIDSRGLAIRDGKVFVYCPDRHFRCLDGTSGDVLWTNAEKLTLELIEQPGEGLSSTPGWRTQTMVVATPDALVVQGQTRMNVVGVSTKDGSMLWQKSKVTNNPNAIYVDGKVILGVGERGKHQVIDPLTGTVEKELPFYKRACTRLTASTDSFFTRGEGMMRFDRNTNITTVDGAVRPACNDGVIPANGLLYLGPWACDCNLSLIGNVARCAAGNFRFDDDNNAAEHLRVADNPDQVAELSVEAIDWPTYRANRQRSASTPARFRGPIQEQWTFDPSRAHTPSESTAVGDLIFSAGEDGKVRALDAHSGKQRWSFQTGGAIKYPPTIARGRAYIGSGDGHAYCLEATSGRELWRFRAAHTERHLMIYGSMSSTWPVHSGVLVDNGTAYFASGIVDHDGTHVYALDADTGDIRWQNISSGHLNSELRKGVSAQGNLTIWKGELVLAGGNVVSPARYDLKTGKCLNPVPKQGHPQSNGGKFVGVFGDVSLLAGGRVLHSSPRNVSTKGSFSVWSEDRKQQTLNYGGIPPAWNDDLVALANFKYGSVTAVDNPLMTEQIRKGFEGEVKPSNRFSRNLISGLTARGNQRWQSHLGDANEFEPLSLALTPNAVITVARYQDLRRAVPQWFLTALNPDDGSQMFQIELSGEPLPGGLIIDRHGQIIVTLIDGGLVCYGSE